MKLTAAYFLHQSESKSACTVETYGKFIEPTDELAKSAALAEARREAAALKAEAEATALAEALS